MKTTTNRQRGNIEAIGCLIIFALIAIGWGAFAIAWNGARETRTCTVVEKLATGKKDGGNNYILITDKCGQLQVEDSWTNGQFNSTDLYARIQPGTSYTFETVGWRNGLFSQYPNVVKVSQ